MNNIESVISSIMTQFSDYDLGINEDMLYEEVVLRIREFGNLATEYFEDVLRIEQGRAKLPDNFYKMETVLKCNSTDDNVSDITILELIKSEPRVNYNIETSSWNNCCYCTSEKGYSVENVDTYSKREIHNSKCYSNFEPIKIKKHINKKHCSKRCFQNADSNSGIEITINPRSNRIESNINDGDIYVYYKGFPLDEEGEFDFTDTPNSNLYQYILYCLREKVAEMLAIKSGGSQAASMFKLYSQNKMIYRIKAKNELISERFDYNRYKNRLQKENRKDYLRRAKFGR